MKSKTGYFFRRADEEREAAHLAEGRKARDTHLELADRYEELGILLNGQAERAGAK